jgi:DNA-binding cell septation regulator SpoVG
MGIGVVLDTNILVHAKNEDVYCNRHCINIMNHLIDSKEDYIYLDIDFSINESDNRSPIGREYNEHLHIGDIGYTCIIKLLDEGRISFIPLNVKNQKVRKEISRLPVKQGDKKFISLAFNSEGKKMISEDFEDIKQPLRNELEKSIGVLIIQAYQIFQPKIRK